MRRHELTFNILELHCGEYKYTETEFRATKDFPVSLWIDLLCRLILALIQTRCVNLKKVATALYGPAQVDSHYRRLQRFFAQQISPEIFATLILARIAQEGQHLYLTLDRTHWKLGKTHQNIFCLGILFQGVSIPFMYEVLGKAGNSNTIPRSGSG